MSPEPPPATFDRVSVVTGARLHFGLFAPFGSNGRAYGGCGMMVDEPRTEVVLQRADEDVIDAGEPDLVERVRRARDRCRSRFGGDEPVAVRVARLAPPHAGFGSGTQVALAVAAGWARLLGIGSADLVETTGRGRRSAIGVHGFTHGGFLVDAGRGEADQLGELTDRIDVPSLWRVILVTPTNVAGLSGRDERSAFDTLTPDADRFADRMRARIRDDVLPALRAEDFDRFAEAIHEHGRDAGRAFASVQGGIYSNEVTAMIVEWFEGRDVVGVGQTSWGPTVFAFAPSATEARSTVEAFNTTELARGAAVRIATPRNEGATIALGQPG